MENEAAWEDAVAIAVDIETRPAENMPAPVEIADAEGVQRAAKEHDAVLCWGVDMDSLLDGCRLSREPVNDGDSILQRFERAHGLVQPMIGERNVEQGRLLVTRFTVGFQAFRNDAPWP